MDPFEELQADLLAALAACQEAGELPRDLALERVTVEPPRDPEHGDVATNAAMVLAKDARRSPLELAELLAARLRALAKVTAAEVARPGFINLRLADDFWRRQIKAVLDAGAEYGVKDLGGGAAVNVEYCSVNPTGRLHIGHGRGTVFGDALANLLARMGWRVTREYYINDGGGQIEALARSVHYRYLEALDCAPPAPPEGWYPLPELATVGREIALQDRDRWQHASEHDWLPVFRSRSVAAVMRLIRDDLAALGVHHDVFTSEMALVAEGKVDEAARELEAKDLVYTGTLPPPKGKPDEDWEPVPLPLFRATRFGDDVDRPLRSSNGAWTYFGKDVAYHRDKFVRGFAQMIDVWGADHGGYVKRMRAAVAAISDQQAELDVKLCQLVNLLDNGQPLRMSKRAGRIVTLRDVVDEVGKDVVRFIMLTRRNDAPLDFDLAKVVEQSRDNPVFYVQYAHARICSVQRHAEDAGLALQREVLARAPLERLRDPAELTLIKLMAQFPRALAAAATHHEPHRIAFYLGDLAAAFHALWNRGKEHPELRFLQTDQAAETAARLALITAVQTVIAAGLAVIGVTPVQELV